MKSMDTSLGFESEQLALFRAEDLWLVVVLWLHFLVFYRFHYIWKHTFLWVHAHVVVPQWAFKLYSSRCVLSASVVPAIVCRWDSGLFGVGVEDSLGKCLVKGAFLRYAEWPHLCCLGKTFYHKKSTRGRLSCSGAGKIKSAACLGRFGLFVTWKMICFYR